MKKQSFVVKASVLTVGVLFTLFIASLALALPAQADQPAEQAYDHYIGHLGVKNVKPPYIGAVSAA